VVPDTVDSGDSGGLRLQFGLQSPYAARGGCHRGGNFTGGRRPHLAHRASSRSSARYSGRLNRHLGAANGRFAAGSSIASGNAYSLVTTRHFRAESGQTGRRRSVSSPRSRRRPRVRSSESANWETGQRQRLSEGSSCWARLRLTCSSVRASPSTSRSSLMASELVPLVTVTVAVTRQRNRQTGRCQRRRRSTA
jgi:hypothetical protein